MSENLKKFLEEASKNEELKAKLAALTDKENAVEKIVEIAKEYGLPLNASDFKPVDGEELPLDQLGQVAGGGYEVVDGSGNVIGTYNTLEEAEFAASGICPRCGKVFSGKQAIDNHIKEWASGQK